MVFAVVDHAEEPYSMWALTVPWYIVLSTLTNLWSRRTNHRACSTKMPPLQSYKRRCVACQHFPDDQTLRLQAGAGEDIIHLPSGLDRVDCERQEEEEATCWCISGMELPRSFMVRTATLKQKLLIKYSISPSLSQVTPGKPVSVLTPVTSGAWQGSHWRI